jgi:predicted ATPase/class 3 adenylate cyclase
MDQPVSFGRLLRERRKAHDLTQEQLAEQAHCSLETIRKIETGKLRPSQQLAAKFANTLAVPAEERAAFLQVARAPLSTALRAVTSVTFATAPLPSGTITFLFSDIEGSTQLWEQYPQAMPEVLARHSVLLRAIITAHGGVVFRTIGDAVCAAFTQSTDALAAALEVQQALHAAPPGLTSPLRVRMALHTGVVEPGGDDYQGLALSRVARLLAAGHGGQILISGATEELVREHLPPDLTLRDLGAYRLKDHTHPEHIFQLVVSDLPTDFPPLQTLTVQHNLPPQPTPFIGREKELAEIVALLGDPDCRLLTLVGPGGIGKSRVALRAAEKQIDSYLHGAYLVPLAGVGSADVLPSVIATALGIELYGQAEPRQQLLSFLRDREILLVLDNFEHLLDGVRLVSDLLQHAPRVKILVTSRERLNLQSEWVFTIEGLPFPETESAARIEQYSAVALFVQIARRVRTSFALDETKRPSVARICQLVEGMPLAIELAASWTHTLSCREIAREVEQSIGFLATSTRDVPERHRSMQSALDHCQKLLSEGERDVFQQLSVFRGGFTREAAEQVAGASLPILSSLVDKSLLRRTANGRYEIHEIIRQYAGAQLEASGSLATMQDRHLDYFLQLAESADRVIHTAEYPDWLVRLDTDIDNLRAALSWGQRTLRGSEAGLRLVGALGWFWYLANRWREGREWAERMLAVVRSVEHPLAWAKAVFTAGGLATTLDDYATAEQRLQESVALFRQEDDLRGQAYALCVLGMARLYQGDHASARALEEESMSVFQAISDKHGYLFALGSFGEVVLYREEYERAKGIFSTCVDLSYELGIPSGLAYAWLNLGKIARYQGDYVTAQAYSEQSAGLAQEIGIQRYRAMALHNLGWISQQGHSGQARVYFVESLGLFRELGDRMGMTECLEGLANHVAVQGHWERAARLFGAAMASREAIQAPPTAGDRMMIDKSIAAARQVLNGTRFNSLWVEGSGMTLEQAIAYALGEDDSGAKRL